MIQPVLIKQIHSNGLQRIIRYVFVVDQDRLMSHLLKLQTTELLALAIIVGISGSLAAYLTPRKG